MAPLRARLATGGIVTEYCVMRVELSSTEGRAVGFTHQYGDQELTLGDERVQLAEPPLVSGQTSRKLAKIVVKGRVNAMAQVECDRCLKTLTIPIDTEFKVEYETPEAYRDSEIAELGDEDMGLSVLEGEVVDIDEIVREQILLAVPSQALCDVNCKGLCPVCGADQNLTTCTEHEAQIDPRWKELEKLVK